MDNGINFNYGLGGNPTDNFNDAFKTAKTGYVSSVVDGALARGDTDTARRQAIANGLYEKYAPVLKNLNDEQLATVKRHNDATGSAALALSRLPKEARAQFLNTNLRPGLISAGVTDEELSGLDVSNDQVLQGLVMRSLGAKDALDRFDYSKDGIADKLTGQYTQFATPGTDHVSVGPNGEQILTSSPGRARTTYSADGTILSGGPVDPVTTGYTNTGPAAPASGGGAVGSMPAYTNQGERIGGVPVDSLVHAESRGNVNAVSPKGAMGRFQIMPSTARDPGYGITPARDNSDGELSRVGRDYLAAMGQKYGNDARKVAAAYNAGPGNVDRAIARARVSGGDFLDYLPRETQDYVPRVLGGSRSAPSQNVAPQNNGPQPGSVMTTPNGTRITTLSGATRMTEAQRQAYQENREDRRFDRQDARDAARYAREDARNQSKEAASNLKGESTLRKDFNNLPEVKSFRIQQGSMKTMYALAKTPNAANDIALIFSYMKVLDPNSTVREGEFATAQNAGGIDTRVWNAYNRLKNGERLSPQQRNQFLGAARQSYNAAEGQYNDRATEYQRYATEQGANPLNVAPRMVPRKPAAGVSNTPKVGEVRRGYQFMGGNPASPNSWKKVN